MKKAGLVVLALAQLTCAGAPLTAPTGATLQIFANPEFIVANGGVSVISVLVVEPAGTLVPDGTVVQFFSSLGKIDQEGKTRDGVARVNLVADSRSGTATVTATSGGATPVTKDVAIGSALPKVVVVTAEPNRILSPRYSLITANVYDSAATGGGGNPVANVPVIFTVTGSPLESEMDSGGRPIYTDTNGRAQDFMVTRAANDGVQRKQIVTATAAGGVSGSVTVFIN